MTTQFIADTADGVWRAAAKALIEGKDFHRQESRLGPTRELLHCAFVLQQPRQRWVLSRRPAINPAFAIAETVWILQGRDDADFLNFWNPVLPNFAGHGTRYYGAYGQRLRRNSGFDQLERAYQTLTHNPDSRQVVLQIWDSSLDLPDVVGCARAPDIPCNVVAMPKIRGGRLEWLQVMRSNDLFLGTPHNFVQFTVLQEVMAGWLGIEPGTYVQISDSLHFYEKDMSRIFMAEEQRSIYNPDVLGLPKDDFDRMLPDLGSAMDRLRADDLSKKELCTLVRDTGLPKSWQSPLALAAADAARRRDWREEMEKAADQCTNPMLRTAWDSWLERTAGLDAFIQHLGKLSRVTKIAGLVETAIPGDKIVDRPLGEFDLITLPITAETDAVRFVHETIGDIDSVLPPIGKIP
ncbi:MAG: thymidylate synthase [Alphaproteobacteria bacterium]